MTCRGQAHSMRCSQRVISALGTALAATDEVPGPVCMSLDFHWGKETIQPHLSSVSHPLMTALLSTNLCLYQVIIGRNIKATRPFGDL